MSRVGRWCILVIFATVSITSVFVWCYYPHLLYCYSRRIGAVAHVEAIPGREMPTKNVGSDWLRFDTDTVTLTLPPGYARVEPSRDGSAAVFKNGPCRVALLIDSHPVSVREIVHAVANETHSRVAQKHYRSLPQLRFACFQASTGDFEWCMSAEEVSLLMLRLKLSQHVRAVNNIAVESFWGERFDGLLEFSEHGALFGWESIDGASEGKFIFKNEEGPIDQDVVRAVCQAIVVM